MRVGKVRAGERTWARLAEPAIDEPETFDPATLEHLPAPAARFLLRVLPSGTSIGGATEIEMAGRIRLGPAWLRFRADQILRAGIGFVWRPVVGGRFLRLTGADLLGPDDARMDFRLHGWIPVVRGSGPDIARSAAGRLAAETVLWLPQAVTPQAGATWTGVDDDRAIVTMRGDLDLPDVEVTVADDGRLLSTLTNRWNGSAKPPARQPFGGPVHDEYVTPSGVHIAGRGAGGWGWTTSEWQRGEFFRYSIVGARP